MDLARPHRKRTAMNTRKEDLEKDTQSASFRYSWSLEEDGGGSTTERWL